ncbi:MAG: hypothetical protein DUD39_03155 [Coriobacteriaceae bacterium]|nr:MAG: hypothetical protein DUD39_03155 [Coriobacteriaceae bacterium]
MTEFRVDGAVHRDLLDDGAGAALHAAHGRISSKRPSIPLRGISRAAKEQRLIPAESHIPHSTRDSAVGRSSILLEDMAGMWTTYLSSAANLEVQACGIKGGHLRLVVGAIHAVGAVDRVDDPPL